MDEKVRFAIPSNVSGVEMDIKSRQWVKVRVTKLQDGTVQIEVMGPPATVPDIFTLTWED